MDRCFLVSILHWCFLVYFMHGGFFLRLLHWCLLLNFMHWSFLVRILHWCFLVHFMHGGFFVRLLHRSFFVCFLHGLFLVYFMHWCLLMSFLHWCFFLHFMHRGFLVRFMHGCFLMNWGLVGLIVDNWRLFMNTWLFMGWWSNNILFVFIVINMLWLFFFMNTLFMLRDGIHFAINIVLISIINFVVHWIVILFWLMMLRFMNWLFIRFGYWFLWLWYG